MGVVGRVRRIRLVRACQNILGMPSPYIHYLDHEIVRASNEILTSKVENRRGFSLAMPNAKLPCGGLQHVRNSRDSVQYMCTYIYKADNTEVVGFDVRRGMYGYHKGATLS